MNGKKVFYSELNVVSVNNYITLATDGGVELSGPTPHIDMHFNNSSKDFTTRIIENSEGDISIIDSKSNRATINANLNGNSETATRLQTIKLNRTNANTVKDNGRYSFSGDNLPNNVNTFFVDVINFDNDNVKQIAMRDYDNATYIRTLNQGHWNSWVIVSEGLSTVSSNQFAINGSITENNIKLRVLNNVVYLSGYFKTTAARNFNDVVGTFAVKPKDDIFLPTFINGQKYGSAEMVISKDGTLRFDAIRLNDNTGTVPVDHYVYLSPISYPII
ncbi:pyocin knob domain-containing protein [uncultured Leuconostoc sp.]|uniref:pyocin knob domain-containing protein n=1 Tax=uncultured Leuconostoc sp. TaxID=173262 RepID=UPI0025CDDE35|nr:pyocin knob domain-containing protein [uncultured Leuconostoc sp.]